MASKGYQLVNEDNTIDVADGVTQNNAVSKSQMDSMQAAEAAALSSGMASKEPLVTPGVASQFWSWDKTWRTITKAMVGLGLVDNTTDASKPVSTPQATAIAVVQTDITTHKANTGNPHAVTKAQVGLGSVPNVDTTNPANIVPDSTHRFATDAEKATWNAKEPAITATTIADVYLGDKAFHRMPTTKTWSGTTVSGVCTIYLTNNGLVGGTAFYASIESIIAAFVGNDTNLGKSYTISGDLKTLTITCTQQSFNGITVVGIPVLGSITVAAVPNGTQLKALVHGIPA